MAAPSPAAATRPLYLPLPRYATDEVWFMAATLYEIAVYAGAWVGAGLLSLGRPFGVSAAAPLRWANERWCTLLGLRTIALAREGAEPLHLRPEHLRAFERLPRAEQRGIAALMGDGELPVAGVFGTIDEAVRVLMMVPEAGRADFCTMLAQYFRVLPEAPTKGRRKTLYRKLCALPAAVLIEVAAQGAQARDALPHVRAARAAAVAWFLESCRGVFEKKAAWLVEAPNDFEALHRMCCPTAEHTSDAADRAGNYKTWVERVLQEQSPAPMSAVLAALHVLRDKGHEQQRFASFNWLIQATPEQRRQFAQITHPELLAVLLAESAQGNEGWAAGLLRLQREVATPAPRLLTRMVSEEHLRYAVLEDLTTAESLRDVNGWAGVRLAHRHEAETALAMRRAGVGFTSIRLQVAMFCDLKEEAQQPTLQRFAFLLQHKDWDESDTLIFAARHPVAHEVMTRLIGRRTMSRPVAAIVIHLSEAGWRLACAYPDDLEDLEWLQWVSLQSDALLTELRGPEGNARVALQAESTWSAVSFPGMPKDVAKTLAARAPSLRWLQKMLALVAHRPPFLLPMLDVIEDCPAEAQLEIICALKATPRAEAVEPLLRLGWALVAQDVRWTHDTDAATGVDAAIAELRRSQAIAAYTLFCDVGGWNGEVRGEIERLLTTFMPLLTRMAPDDRHGLLAMLDAPRGAHTLADFRNHIRHTRQHALVSEALAWCGAPARVGPLPAVDARDAWARDRQIDACAEALAACAPTDLEDLQDELMPLAAALRGAHVLAGTLAELFNETANDRYLYLRSGTAAQSKLGIETYGVEGRGTTALLKAWGGHGPLPRSLRIQLLEEYALPPDERAAQAPNRDALRFIDANGLHRLMAACEALRLSQPLDLAMRVAALDVFDPPREAAPVRQAGCVSYGCDTPHDEPHTPLAGCACGKTLCDGCAKAALAAVTEIHTCRADPRCGAPLQREYLERLGFTEAAALRRRAQYFREQLMTVPGFEFDVARTDTLHGRLRPEPVYGPDEIPPLPARVNVAYTRALVQGLDASLNPNGIHVDRECYHCAQPVQKDGACLHMGPQEGHQHNWDFERGPYDGQPRFATAGVTAQQYIPLAPGPLARAHFYDGLPPGVMDATTRARVEARRVAWLRQLDELSLAGDAPAVHPVVAQE